MCFLSKQSNCLNLPSIIIAFRSFFILTMIKRSFEAAVSIVFWSAALSTLILRILTTVLNSPASLPTKAHRACSKYIFIEDEQIDFIYFKFDFAH